MRLSRWQRGVTEYYDLAPPVKNMHFHCIDCISIRKSGVFGNRVDFAAVREIGAGLLSNSFSEGIIVTTITAIIYLAIITAFAPEYDFGEDLSATI